MDSSGLLRSIVEGLISRHVAYCRTYSGTVQSQTGDAVDVAFDDPDIPGLCQVPIYTGTPGLRADVELGTRVLVGFIAGDLKRPYALGWRATKAKKIELKTTTTIEATADTTLKLEGLEIDLGGSSLPVARQGDPVQAGPYIGVIQAPCSPKVKAG